MLLKKQTQEIGETKPVRSLRCENGSENLRVLGYCELREELKNTRNRLQILNKIKLQQ